VALPGDGSGDLVPRARRQPRRDHASAPGLDVDRAPRQAPERLGGSFRGARGPRVAEPVTEAELTLRRSLAEADAVTFMPQDDTAARAGSV
jgi:hypothetical protein